MTVPPHHKQIAIHLREHAGNPAKVIAYHDNEGRNEVAIGSFGSGKATLHSTIGVCDRELNLPLRHTELMAIGDVEWIPNVLASSIYWLKERSFSEWPLVCEDVVKQNAKSTYRHMLFIPAGASPLLSSGFQANWLLGFPLRDSQIQMGIGAATEKAKEMYPAWLFSERV